MSVKYVVSIAGQLLYFDEQRNAAPPLQAGSDNGGAKPDLKLLPPQSRPAAAQEWNAALSGFTPDQREAAEISEVH